MPIVIPKKLPAFGVLEKESVFVMPEIRANQQDIRPIEIAIVNLMPTKIETETQLMRVLANTPLQVNITLIKTGSYQSKNISAEHLSEFYITIDDMKKKTLFFDGIIITGAPVESLPFEEVAYWDELKEIMDYAESHATSTLHICWGAQAGLFYKYGIQKYDLAEKMFGVFENIALTEDVLLKGLDDKFNIPMSRHTAVIDQQLYCCADLEVLARCDGGISVAKSRDNKNVYFMGHSEYDRETLRAEYLRDIDKGLKIAPPQNYFVDNDVDKINMSWRSSAFLLFNNWLNYYVYQETPYEITKIN